MTTSLIPETAPFSPEQRAWLNGFLAGWTGLAAPETPVDGTLSSPVAVLTGGATTNGAAADEEHFPWHDDSLALEDRLALAEGKPLKRRLMAAMAQLDCGACGYVCKTYSEAIAAGNEKNLTLCSPGGKDTSKMLKKLLKEEAPATNGAAASTNGHMAPAASATAECSRSNPFPARLKECFNLNGEGSAKHTSHVVIDLAGSGLSYRVGDALGVYPTNCPDLVNAILERLAFARNNGAGGKLRAELQTDYDLNVVEEELIEALLAGTSVPEEKEALTRLLEEDQLDEIDVLDALEMAPSVELEATQFLQYLGPINPRLYSIASSLRKHPEEVHLTIAKVAYDARGRVRKGVASTMFADRLQPSEDVRVFVHKSADFTVPADPQAPMIMVGPGTGIAPFRAFLQERQATGASGKNWLFFGDQHAACDFLYRQELESLQAQGVLTRLDTAFSRDQEEKVYVQDRLREQGSALFEWLEQGGYFFVCGDARRMAADVDRALHDVVQSHGGMSADEAAAYVQRMKAEKRYVRDVY